MKTLTIAMILIMSFLILVQESMAFAPKGKDFGIGFMAGEPTGLTAKIWTTQDNALAFSVGTSYLGSLRIGMDYLWHFNAFNSQLVNMYAGPGVAVGFGKSGGWVYRDKNHKWYRTNDDVGVGIRGVTGINIVPRNSPIELFGEIGVLVGVLPATYANFEGAIGIRFYF